MFGLNEITWKEFLQFIILLLVIWYLALFIWSWLKSKNKSSLLFEDQTTSESLGTTAVKPIVVSSSGFPSRLISPLSENFIPLEVSYYEENGPDDGIHIDYLLNELTGKLEELLPGIQYQQ